MVDQPYKRENVDPDVQPVFEQLRTEFGKQYEVWARVDNFGLWVTAAVTDPPTRTVAEVRIKTETNVRGPLSPSNITSIRDHLASGAGTILAVD